MVCGKLGEVFVEDHGEQTRSAGCRLSGDKQISLIKKKRVKHVADDGSFLPGRSPSFMGLFSLLGKN